MSITFITESILLYLKAWQTSSLHGMCMARLPPSYPMTAYYLFCLGCYSSILEHPVVVIFWKYPLVHNLLATEL